MDTFKHLGSTAAFSCPLRSKGYASHEIGKALATGGINLTAGVIVSHWFLAIALWQCRGSKKDKPEMGGLAQDLRYALRQLRKDPVFAAVAVVTLALAVGANTAIFSVVQTVLLAPLPYEQVDRLAMIWGRNPSRGDMEAPISPGDFTEWKQKNQVFEDIAPSYDDQVTLSGAGEPKLLLGYDVSPSYFRILGVPPRIGRVFTEDEASSGAH
ncbi:MAG TPA: ABC transporter permease, partial [Candidatus Acidoferrum sp.]|nr:ABC transporter permease [Candidatus Acidoferrum sp.]